MLAKMSAEMLDKMSAEIRTAQEFNKRKIIENRMIYFFLEHLFVRIISIRKVPTDFAMPFI